MVKLAVIFSVYDSEELLEGSIRQIREQVDVVIAVVQKISNWGEEYTGGLLECVRLQSLGLIDVVTSFDPMQTNDRLNGCKNETEKRRIGFELAKEKGCTHYIHMDCDEYYFSEEFLKSKDWAIENDIEASYCKIQAYEKYPTLALENLENYYVPFINKIQDNLKHGFCEYPVLVDPTRKATHRNPKEAPITMHHYTSIRKNIARKYRNSSARCNFDLEAKLHEFAQIRKENGNGRKLVPNYFGINEYSSESI
jgi:hypothetical protein